MEGIKEIRLTNVEATTLLDAEDFYIAASRNWYTNSLGYVYSKVTVSPKKYKSIFLHRLVIGAKGKEIVDHINMNPLDNRRENLRIVTKSQNMMNRKAPAQNTSGYKGVVWDKYNKKWTAQIQSNGKHKKIGRFLKKEDAARAYNEAAIKLHGEYSNLNEI